MSRYNKEWEAEMAKLTKKQIIEIAAQIGKNNERLLELAELRANCHHYLMCVPAEKITVADALEALGYGRNGLNF
jgi:hypothetical protein